MQVQKKYLWGFMLLFVLFDIGLSGYKYFQQPLYGDVVPLILPDARNAPVLSDPFGFKALKTEVYHPNINRFFACASLYGYMRTMPFALQKITDPIQSLYWSTALFKLMTHLAFLFLLAHLIKPLNFPKKDYLLILFMVTPFMMIGTYLRPVQIVEFSIVYNFVYSFPFIFLLIFLLPFFRMLKQQERDIALNKWEWLGMVGLMILLSFSSAIVPPTVLLGGGLFLTFRFFQARGNLIHRIRQLPFNASIVLGLFFFLCLYSFYLGFFNSESVGQPDLGVRYTALIKGVKNTFIFNLAMPLLWGTLFLNHYLLKRQKIMVWGQPFSKLLYPLIIFSIIYILLLPLGGYRSYRPEIIRADMLIPVSLSTIFLLTLSTFYLIKYFKEKKSIYYLSFFLMLQFVFCFYDYISYADDKACEEAALYSLAAAKKSPVVIDGYCKIVDWETIGKPTNSANHAKLFKFWNITEEEILFSVKEK